MTTEAQLDPQLLRSLSEELAREVRTPLHSLLGFLELLAMGELTGDQRSLVEDILVGADALASATDRLLVLATSGDRTAHRQAATLADLLAAGVDGAGPGADGHVQVSVADGVPPRLVTDVAALVRVVTELVANALAHGCGPVTVSARTSGGPEPRLHIEVGDAGPGPDAALLGDPVAREAETRSGIGLLLVRRLVAALGGTVTADRGAVRVEVALEAVLPHAPAEQSPPPVAVEVAPVEPAAPAAAPVEPATPAPAGTEPAPAVLRVLLAEDNAVNRLLAERQVARLGHTLTSVATGSEAVEAALTGAYDVVLLDRHLPDLDGLTVARRIRAGESPGQRLPLVAVTADASPGTREACLAAGMDDYLTKPLDLPSLAAALARHGSVEAAPGGALDEPTLGRLAVELGDEAALAEVLDTYLRELPGRRLRIKAAAKQGSPVALQAAAESLRGSSAVLGAVDLASSCAAVARHAASEDLAAALDELPRLLVRSTAVQRALHDRVEGQLPSGRACAAASAAV